MGVGIRQLHPLFVGEVSGMNLSRPLDGAGVRALWDAIDRYAVLVFHDQRLSDVQLRDFAGKFGKLEIGRSAAEGGKRRLALPEIGDISNLDEEAGCARVTTAGASTASATVSGTRTRPTCLYRSCSECCMRSPCRRPARWAAARPNSPTCARPTTRYPRR